MPEQTSLRIIDDESPEGRDIEKMGALLQRINTLTAENARLREALQEVAHHTFNGPQGPNSEDVKDWTVQGDRFLRNGVWLHNEAVALELNGIIAHRDRLLVRRLPLVDMLAKLNAERPDLNLGVPT